jgi:hypothetical protein
MKKRMWQPLVHFIFIFFKSDGAPKDVLGYFNLNKVEILRSLTASEVNIFWMARAYVSGSTNQVMLAAHGLHE